VSPQTPDPEQPRKAIPADVARRLEDRSEAFGRATSRPEGKPWAANTYGAGRPLTDAERKARAKAIRDRDAAAKRAAEHDPKE
jgi:hypothetical protein